MKRAISPKKPGVSLANHTMSVTNCAVSLMNRRISRTISAMSQALPCFIPDKTGTIADLPVLSSRRNAQYPRRNLEYPSQIVQCP